jgi:calcineurin-like phosphoesterase family protein
MTRIIHISDTHSHHRKLNMPHGNILICSGDITRVGSLEDIFDFAKWVKELPYANKICIYGNHELGHSKPGPKRQKGLEMLKEAGIIYLENSGVIINDWNIWGSPITPEFHSWEWNAERGPQIRKYWDMIPDNTNILICHGMPYGILDAVPRYNDYAGAFYENVGCKDLLNRINELKHLKLFCGGHLHPGHGQLELNGVKFVNASFCQDGHKGFNSPIVIDL